MLRQNLHIKFLKHVSINNGLIKDVECKNIIIKSFKEELNLSERVEIKKFLKFLTENGFIKLISSIGITFANDINGNLINKKNISVIVRITPKGKQFLEENNKAIKYNITFYLSILFGFSTLLFAFCNFYLRQNQDFLINENANLKIKNDSLLKVNSVLKEENTLFRNSKHPVPNIK